MISLLLCILQFRKEFASGVVGGTIAPYHRVAEGET